VSALYQAAAAAAAGDIFLSFCSFLRSFRYFLEIVSTSSLKQAVALLLVLIKKLNFTKNINRNYVIMSYVITHHTMQ